MWWNRILNEGMVWELKLRMWKLRRCSKSEQSMVPFRIFDMKDTSINSRRVSRDIKLRLVWIEVKVGLGRLGYRI